MKATAVFALICLAPLFMLGQTQLEMNEAAASSFDKADKELNAVYQKVLVKYNDDPLFIKNLKSSQRIWLQLKDAEMKVKYPQTAPGYYGSIYPLCWTQYLQELTEERTKKLKLWLVGIEEGNACAGAIKIKD